MHEILMQPLLDTQFCVLVQLLGLYSHILIVFIADFEKHATIFRIGLCMITEF
jgi:hypothetical protein